MINNLKVEEERMSTNQLISLELDIQKFDLLMGVYEKALNQVFDTLLQVKAKLYSEFSYDIINNISRRIKTPESIIDKMKKKHYDIDFKNIIENINDVAGIRITCPVKNDIYTILDIIEKLSNI
ncbi:MAG: GTP pyrophosphokinase family protein, partial [Clostridia bacterium]|nr:GTP pyrophosphokinase family protein [Clostridia bacterium]